MPLAHMNDVLTHAEHNHYAVGAFEVWNMESAQAVVGVAANLQAPVIVAIGPLEIGFGGLEPLSVLARDCISRSDFPIVLHLDHGNSFEQAVACVRNGFNSVMIDASHEPFDRNVEVTREVVRMAHAVGVHVEGELGRLVGVETGHTVTEAEACQTDPDEARDYVEKTGIDSLAVAIGNVHGFYKGRPNLNIERLKTIKRAVNVPIVLHGASNIPRDIVQEAIRVGVSKFNIATDFISAFARAAVEVMNPAPDTINVPACFNRPVKVARELVETKIRLSMSDEKAAPRPN